MDNKINFTGIGSGKSASSWLWENIVKHPEISSFNAKEINYFSNLYSKKSSQWYNDLFEKNKLVKGEFSVTYLDDKNAAKRIHEYSSEIKIICILRNPTDRIISDYYHSIRKGSIPYNLSLSEYVKIEKNLSFGKYKHKIERFKKYFDDNQLLILEMESCLKNKEISLKTIFKFLKLNNTDFIPKEIDSKVNKGFLPKIRVLENFITFVSQFLTKIGAIKSLEILKKTNIHNIIRKFNASYDIPEPDKYVLEYLNDYFNEEKIFFKNNHGFNSW